MKRSVTYGVPLLIAALLALQAAALGQSAGPKVVALDVVTDRPVEVGVSPKQLTLIHFESDVTMVAVGDPSLVNVTVKGPDVLVKAQAYSGKTNAFIWVAGVYTQWVFAIRDSAADPRVIIVKEKAEEVKTTSPARPQRSAGTGPVTVTQAYTPPKPEKPAPPQKQPPTPAQPQKTAPESGPGPSPLDIFVKSLTKEQADLFAAFLKDPNLATLAALMRVLNDEQRKLLMNMLISHQALVAAGREKQAAPTEAGSQQQKKEQEAQQKPGPEQKAGEAPPVTVAAVSTELPDGVDFSVTPKVVGEKLFISYVLQNTGQATLLADSLRLKVHDADGNRLPYVITRTSETGYVGRLVPGGVEAGIISLEPKAKQIVLEWTLVTVGTGDHLVIRARIAVP
jgi:hypothetical protein